MTFIRLTNFFCDIVFLRKKMTNDEDKRILTEVYSSLTKIKTKFWYAFESSGNYNKFKYIINLLLANPSQRAKLADIDGIQKEIDNFMMSYLDQ
jgi:hypothetical protein